MAATAAAIEDRITVARLGVSLVVVCGNRTKSAPERLCMLSLLYNNVNIQSSHTIACAGAAIPCIMEAGTSGQGFLMAS